MICYVLLSLHLISYIWMYGLATIMTALFPIIEMTHFDPLVFPQPGSSTLFMPYNRSIKHCYLLNIKKAFGNNLLILKFPNIACEISVIFP